MSDKNEGTSRRNFLKLGGMAAPAVALAAATGSPVDASETPEAAKSGLQDTPHTRKYLETARF
ncbi:twin-arginine translocation signal domain-containing protein [Marimonas arenosa]|uniref:Twin-arginine translocation signal domain-containing protein n=1 Tax=Marimonas arenosa TaxID=1795305 RepID=A0AAE4B6J2_9RHOB|nr:twin-arginine translocation signal domain-containing protein [Marimonas arenosa]MDQ2092182.1 twin-arginine translocation signal domain-containing protein [Marimonas arenosa]